MVVLATTSPLLFPLGGESIVFEEVEVCILSCRIVCCYRLHVGTSLTRILWRDHHHQSLRHRFNTIPSGMIAVSAEHLTRLVIHSSFADKLRRQDDRISEQQESWAYQNDVRIGAVE